MQTAQAVRVLPGVLIAAALLHPSPCQAQPVSTEDKVIRARVGIQTVPTRDEVTHKLYLQQRTFADFLYRFTDNLDLGFALPTVIIDPKFGAANPTVLGFYHLVHQPHWAALRFEFEPPVLAKTGWRLSLFLSSTLRLGPYVEFFNLPGARVPLDDLRDSIYSWQSAFLFRFTPTFGFGPSGQIRFTNDGFDEFLVGGRLRWEWRDHERTRGVFYADLATSSIHVTGQTLAILAYYQFFIRI